MTGETAIKAPYSPTEELPPFRQSLRKEQLSELAQEPTLKLEPISKLPIRSKSIDSHFEESKEAWSFRNTIKEELFHRAEEERILNESFDEMLLGKSSLVLVTGPVGTGKTRLVNVLQPRAHYFLTGKFDQLSRPEPYRALVNAFSQFTSLVLQRGPGAVEQMRQRILDCVGDEASVLISMIPALEQILGKREDQQSNHKAEDAIQRFVFVFRMFMRAVASPEEPMVLLLDDLHWADRCSLDLIAYAVGDLENNPGLFIVGTCDDSDVLTNAEDGNYLGRKIQEMQSSIKAHIKLQNLDHEQIHHLLRDVLKLPCDKCSELVQIVAAQTNGNLFYIIEFVRWLEESEMLYRKGGSWEWDGDEIRMSVNICCACDFLKSKLFTFDEDDLDVLKVASCFGSKFCQKLVEDVIRVDQPVGEILEAAVHRGILVRFDNEGSYAFEHDGMQEATYALIDDSDRELFHLEIGRRLWRRLDDKGKDDNLFVVLSQMNFGRRLIKRLRERYFIASLCLTAATKAAKSSTFRTATVYLDLALELLGDSGWDDEYELTVAIYNAAAEMHMCIADFEKMDELIDTLLSRVPESRPRDRVQALSTRLYAMGCQGQQQEALDLGIQILAGFGEHFPRRMCHARLASELKKVQKMLKGKSNDQLLRMKAVEDPDILACLQVCNLMFLPALMVRPNLSRFLGLKMMLLTLKHGHSFLTPLAFGCYGIVCCVKLRDLDGAIRFGELGLECIHRFQVREYLPRVYASYYGCIFSLKRPIRESLEHLMHAYHVGMQTGDTEFGCLNANLYNFIGQDAGVPLPTIARTWKNLQADMKKLRQQSLLEMTGPCSQAAQHYMGLTPDPLSPKGMLFDLDEALQQALDLKLTGRIQSICMSRSTLCYTFNDYATAERFALLAVRNIWDNPVLYEVAISSFYCALAMLAVAADGKRTRAALKQSKCTLGILSKLSLYCPENYSHMKCLVEAETYSVRGKSCRARESYQFAIAMSEKNSFLFLQGISNERAARHCLREGDKDAARPFFQASIKAFEQWGGMAKVDRLQKEIDDLYPNSVGTFNDSSRRMWSSMGLFEDSRRSETTKSSTLSP